MFLILITLLTTLVGLGLAEPIHLKDFENPEVHVHDQMVKFPMDMFKVRVLYIVPSDKQPRPNIDILIHQILQYISDWYYDKLGVTVSYKYPLYEVVRSNINEADIFNGTYGAFRHFTDPDKTINDEGRNTIQHMIDLVDKEYNAERYINHHIFIGITEADIWAALGGGGYAHTGNVALINFENRPILAWAVAYLHELGHALGLPHTNDTLSCLNELGVNLEYEYNYMTGGVPKFESDPTMSEHQIQLLTNMMYNPDCLLVLNGVPHPANYLTNTNPCINRVDIDGNGIVNVDDLATLITNWGLCSADTLCLMDFDCNGVVDLNDLAMLLVNWG